MQVTGHVLRSRYVYMRRAGEEGFAGVIAALGPQAREVMEEGPLETNWYSYDVYIEVSEVMDRVLGNGDMQLCQELGGFSCELNLTGIFRVFFRFGNIGFLLDRAAKAWHSQYDFGTMTVTRDPDNRQRVTLEVSDVPRPHIVHYLAIKGWALKAADLSGAEITTLEDHFDPTPNASMIWTFEYI